MNSFPLRHRSRFRSSRINLMLDLGRRAPGVIALPPACQGDASDYGGDARTRQDAKRNAYNSKRRASCHLHDAFHPRECRNALRRPSTMVFVLLRPPFDDPEHTPCPAYTR